MNLKMQWGLAISFFVVGCGMSWADADYGITTLGLVYYFSIVLGTWNMTMSLICLFLEIRGPFCGSMTWFFFKQSFWYALLCYATFTVLTNLPS